LSASSKYNDSSLRKHLGTVHHMRDVLYPSQKGEFKAMEKRVKELNDAAIQAIILDSRSFGDFRRPGMQLFLAIALPGYRGPHRHTVSRRIHQMYDQYCVKLKSLLSTISSVSLTCDLWQIRKMCFMCLTVHFLDDNFQQQCFVIAFRRVKG
jgi:hypothetical protein